MKNFSKLRCLFAENYKKIKLSLTEKQEITCIKTKDNLKNMIMQHVSGKEISIQDLEDEMSQLRIEFFQNKGFNEEYYNFLSFLKRFGDEDGRNDQKIYKKFSNAEEWKRVIKIYAKWGCSDNTDLLIREKIREKMIAKVSQELKKYKVKVENGRFVLDDNKLLKIQSDIEGLIKKMGGQYCLKSIFERLQLKYCFYAQRYLFPKHYNEEPELEIPYNFLINVSLKHIKETGKKKYKSEKYLNRLIRLSSRYAFLFDLQDFHVINKNSFPQHWTVEDLYKNILYDHVFRFRQMSTYNILFILKSLFMDLDNKFIEKLGFSLNDYLRVVRKLYDSPNNYMVKFPFEIFNSKELKILDFISHVNSNINNDYVKLNEFTKIDFFSKPLIKLDNGYLLVDKNYCGWSFYEVILRSLSYPDIGKNLENIIYKSLLNEGYKLYKGKYKNSKQEHGECDIVVETDKKIIFIEIKKKAITSKSLEGDYVKIVEDIIDSFIHSQEQILRHEYSIKMDGKILFDNGDVLYLNNKDVVRLSISLFDSFMLSDRQMTANIFEFFQKIRFSNPTKKLEERNDKLDSVSEKLRLIYKDEKQSYKNTRYDIYFLSLEVFLFYLKVDKPIDKVLQDIRQVSFCTGDLFFEYISLMKIKNGSLLV